MNNIDYSNSRGNHIGIPLQAMGIQAYYKAQGKQRSMLWCCCHSYSQTASNLFKCDYTAYETSDSTTPLTMRFIRC